MKLYYSPGACSLASHVALEETGASYETERLDFKAGQQRGADYLQVNPKGKVPALQTERGVLTESPVILGFVAESFPDARLAPVDDSFAFGRMQAFNMQIASTVHPAFAHIFRPARFGEESAAEGMKVKALETIRDFLGGADETLSGREWVHGDYTVSDPYLMVMTRWASGVGIELADFPAVLAHRSRIQARPAVVRVLEAEGLQPS